jgi:hypothetical protein
MILRLLQMELHTLSGMDSVNQKQIKDILVKVDFMNGDVLHFLNHCAEGYVKTYEEMGGAF